MLKVLMVFGTRPEAIKLAPVIREMRRYPEDFEVRVCVTAQHREMLDQVLDIFQIVPDIDLDLMRPNQSLSELTARIFRALDPVLASEQPDWVLAQGDTTTVMGTALVAFYHRVRFGHVEAGLRTGDKWQPFPEEINRKIAGVVADLHFAPTEWARQNLLREGVPEGLIRVTGNPVIDALQWVAALPYPAEKLLRLGIPEGVLQGTQRLILLTAHRRENFGKPLENICEAVHTLAQQYPDVFFVYPVHLNPNVRDVAYRKLSGLPNVLLLPPLDYLTLVQILKRAYMVLTDSGGLQEEAPGLGVPVLVLREVTERPEGVQAGTVKLVGTDPDRIIREARLLLDDRGAYQSMAQAVNPYGDGKAAQRIVRALLEEP